MGQATFKVELSRQPNADSTRSVRIRITRDRQHAYLTTGIRLIVSDGRGSEWNEKYEDRKSNWVKTHRRSAQYNQQIRDTWDELEELAGDNPTLSASELKRKYTARQEAKPVEVGAIAGPPRLFADFVGQVIDRYRGKGKISYALLVGYAWNCFKSYAGPDLSDSRILARPFVHSFDAWLRSATRKNGQRRYSPKTIRDYFKVLEHAFSLAKEEDLFTIRNPFKEIDLYVPPVKQARPEATSIMQLLELELEKAEWVNARNTFLLQFLLNGARVSEVVRLEWSMVKKGSVTYLPSKKAAKWKTVPRNEWLDKILAHYPQEGRYVLPWLSEDFHLLTKEQQYYALKDAKDRVNAALWTISRRHKLPRLTTHMARRAFADAAIREHGDLRMVQHLVGWSSIAIAEHYARELQQEDIEEASRQIFARLSDKQ